MKLIGKGRHSLIFLTERNTVIKRFNPGLQKNFEKEIYFLNKLRDFKFVPKLISYNEKTLEVEMEYISGFSLESLIKNKNIKDLTRVVLKSIDICHFLDKIHVQKEEMHRPLKHVILSDRVVFIDWERSKETEKPSNLTQFLHFLCRDSRVNNIFNLGADYIQNFCKIYKETYSSELVELLKSKIKQLLDEY